MMYGSSNSRSSNKLDLATFRKFLFTILACILMVSITGCAPARPSQESSSVNIGTNEEALPNKIDPSQLPDSSFIYEAPISTLENADSYMNGQTVQVTGEVVGDRIYADEPDNCWITLQSNDGTYAEIDVFMTLASSEVISTYGSYGQHGTDLQVRGVFNLACKDHTGISDLHAQNVTLINAGYSISEDVPFTRFLPGIILLIIGGLIYLLYHYLKEREL